MRQADEIAPRGDARVRAVWTRHISVPSPTFTELTPGVSGCDFWGLNMTACPYEELAMTALL
jgi:hypothetical protein